MKKVLLFLGFLTFLAQPGMAWRPSGWVYFDWPWAYEAASGDWHWFPALPVQWIHGYPPADGWHPMETSPLASGWSFHQWPFAYANVNEAWHYISEANPPSCVNMRTGQWSVFGAVNPVLHAHEAWRGSDAALVPENAKFSPGLLVTPNRDGGATDPLEARLVFKALANSTGYTRHIRFDPPGKVELRLPDESAAAWVPVAADAEIPGPIDQDYIRDVAMYLPDTWSATTSVEITYAVQDPEGNVVASDRVRLLRPVLLALGDSMTFGFMRSSTGTRITPPTGSYSGWQHASNWNAYPDDSQWASLESPWNVAAHKSDAAYQGFRGVLAAELPGFVWAGENTLGHGPRHMGYNGAEISTLVARAPAQVLRTEPCYAIVVYFAGLNDAVGGNSAATMYSAWSSGIQTILNARQGRGKTLVIGVTLPRMASYYSGYTSEKQNQLVALNNSIRSHTVSASAARYRVADAENIPHDTAAGMKDDGLHYFNGGYAQIGSSVAAAIRNGLH